MTELYRPQVHVTPPGGDYRDPLSQVYKFYVFRRTPDGADVLSQDGLWARTTDGEALPPKTWLTLPAEFAPALYDALSASLGKRTPDNYDVLREWLAVERGRVDRVLDWTVQAED